jgi:hypothetical protein
MFLSGIVFTIYNLLATFVITIMLADTSNFEVAGKPWLSVLTLLCVFWHVAQAKLRLFFIFVSLLKG